MMNEELLYATNEIINQKDIMLIIVGAILTLITTFIRDVLKDFRENRREAKRLNNELKPLTKKVIYDLNRMKKNADPKKRYSFNFDLQEEYNSLLLKDDLNSLWCLDNAEKILYIYERYEGIVKAHKADSTKEVNYSFLVLFIDKELKKLKKKVK